MIDRLLFGEDSVGRNCPRAEIASIVVAAVRESELKLSATKQDQLNRSRNLLSQLKIKLR